MYKKESNDRHKGGFRSGKNKVPSSRIIIGRKPVLEAIEANKNIDKIFIQQSSTGQEIAEIQKLSKQKNIATSYVPIEKLNRFTHAHHQGVVALTALTEYMPLQDVIDFINEKGETPLFALLDGITDTRNLGAIARSAFCFGVHAIIIPISNNAAITEEAIKTSAGALNQISICKTPSVEQAIDTLKLNGIQIVAAALQTDENIDSIDFTIPTAVVLGAEDKGVSSYVLKTADNLFQIPMSGNFDSLNVSVAAGIIFYEANKTSNKK